MFEEFRRDGFVILFRSIFSPNWQFYGNSNITLFFIYCLAKANHEDRYYNGLLIKRGSFVTSREIMSQESGLSVRNIRTCISHLKSTNILTVNTSRKGTIISINFYDDWQTSTEYMTHNRPTGDPQPTTNNNYNNYNNGGAPITDTKFKEFYNAYKKKGFEQDTYKYWNEQNYSDEVKEDIIYGAKKFSEECVDIKTMIFPRTFLQDEKWKIYVEERNKEKSKLPNKERVEYLESLGIDMSKYREEMGW